MVEIGSVLRAARERRGLELGEVERETRIRVRYLVALEQERFGLLPARAYAKGFLRVYADFLGLDGRLMVEEFNARFPEVEPPELAVQRASWTHRRRKSWVPVLLIGGLVAAVLAVVVWQLASPEHRPAVPAAPSTGTRPRHAVAAPAPHPRRRAAATLAHLVLRARGPCWLAVRADSGAGPVLYEATLHAGGVLRYTLARARPRLWLRIGAPWNLELSLNGKAATTLPRGPGNVVVTRSGLHPA